MRRCVDHMDTQGLEQWTETYPDPGIIQEDIVRNISFVGRRGMHIVCTAALDFIHHEEYRYIQWEDTFAKAGYLHRFGIDPKYQGMGIGKQAMGFLESYARKNNAAYLRFDTYSENWRSIAFYEKLGYQKHGKIYLPKKSGPYYCYEKKMT